MNIIMGASGQVGSAIVTSLRKKGAQVRGIVRSEKKASNLVRAGAEYVVADAHDRSSLIPAFEGGTTLFVLTPEEGQTADLMTDTNTILENYHYAAMSAKIQRVVGLSSIGAQYAEGTGSLKMSYMLEHAFDNTATNLVFLRPAYYFSNWLPGIEDARKSGILYGFFPDDLSIPMVSPMDVAAFCAELILMQSWPQRIYEIEGPENYTPAAVAKTISEIIQHPVKPQQIPPKNWPDELQKMGFTADSSKNFIEMTKAVIDGKVKGETRNTIRGNTSLKKYLETALR